MQHFGTSDVRRTNFSGVCVKIGAAHWKSCANENTHIMVLVQSGVHAENLCEHYLTIINDFDT